MEVHGTVVEILSPSMILIKAVTSLYQDQILHVFSEVCNDALAKRHGLTHLHIPKGQIRIVAQQGEHYYLAETFRETAYSERVIQKQPSLLSGILGSETVREEKPGPPSAYLDDPTIEMDIARRVTVGDRVGKN